MKKRIDFGLILVVVGAISFFFFSAAQARESSDEVPGADKKEALRAIETPYDLEQWTVREEQVISEALDVFRKKAQPNKRKRIWIYEQSGDKSFFIEYYPNERNPKVIFSPDENFAFFIAPSDKATKMIYGIHLLTGNQYPIADARPFELMACPDHKESYIAVDQNGDRQVYLIYNLNGEPQQQISGILSPQDILQKICY